MRRQVSGGIRSLFFLAATGLLVVASGCGDDDGGSGPGVSPCDGADDCAATYFQALSDSLAAIPDNADEDTIRALRFPDIRAGFDAILAADPGDRIAHLGSGILDILELNHSPDLWAFVDSLSDYADEQEASAAPGIGPAGGLFLHPGSPILRNQFTILATAPRDILRRAALAVPSNLSVANLQSVFETEVIPALSSAIGHFEQAEADGGPTIPVTVDDETHEIDLGEILVFHAATLAARAGFRIATAYDLDLPGPSGDYSWIEGMIDIERCQAWSYFQPKGADEYRRVVVSYDDDGHPADAAAESVAVSIVQYNLESRAGFLTQRSGGMAQAWSDLQTLRDLLEQANASIQAETDDQMDDIIRIMDLTDIESDVANPSGDRPNFATGFTTIQDVLDWVDQVMSGPYAVNEDGPVGPIQITVDLNAFFTSAPMDWKTLLPYHRFQDPDVWIENELVWFFVGPEVLGTTVSATDCDGMTTQRTDVSESRYEYYEAAVENFLELLDGPGGSPIDLEVERVPYMPDYTLGGLFPGATRSTWLTIHENAGW